MVCHVLQKHSNHTSFWQQQVVFGTCGARGRALGAGTVCFQQHGAPMCYKLRFQSSEELLVLLTKQH